MYLFTYIYMYVAVDVATSLCLTGGEKNCVAVGLAPLQRPFSTPHE